MPWLWLRLDVEGFLARYLVGKLTIYSGQGAGCLLGKVSAFHEGAIWDQDH